VETNEQNNENTVAAAIAELKERFPRTQDLYREVCVLLFFRHGVTPTANKLYQLVRKGSMSAPTEALNDFWDTLRERSRVSVEHADLPDELKTAAGDMVAAVWKSAQAMARESVAQLRQEAAAAAESARNAEAEAKAAENAASAELERTRERLREVEGLNGELRQELAAAGATNAGTVTRMEDVRQLLNQTQEMLARERDEHANEREKLAERNRLAEQRFADMEKRAGGDRPRTHGIGQAPEDARDRASRPCGHKRAIAHRAYCSADHDRPAPGTTRLAAKRCRHVEPGTGPRTPRIAGAAGPARDGDTAGGSRQCSRGAVARGARKVSEYGQIPARSRRGPCFRRRQTVAKTGRHVPRSISEWAVPSAKRTR
jgi:hypothetical protein